MCELARCVSVSVHVANSGFLPLRWCQDSWTSHTAALFRERERRSCQSSWRLDRELVESYSPRPIGLSKSQGQSDSRGRRNRLHLLVWGVACMYNEEKHQWWLSLETLHHMMGFFQGCTPDCRNCWDCTSMCQAGTMSSAVCEGGKDRTFLAPNLMLTLFHCFSVATAPAKPLLPDTCPSLLNYG